MTIQEATRRTNSRIVEPRLPIPERRPWRGLLGDGTLQFHVLTWIAQNPPLAKRTQGKPLIGDLRATWTDEQGLVNWIESREEAEDNVSVIFGDQLNWVDRDVLDLGCGQGRLAAQIYQSGARSVTGLDGNSDGWELENARIYLKAKRLLQSIPLTEADGAQIPYHDQAFDLIIMNDVGDHIIKLGETLAECYRVLRPGGQVFIKFIPFYHPFGHHLKAFVPLPWMHALFGERTVVKAIRALAATNASVRASIPGLNRAQAPTNMDQLGIILSRQTIRSFRKLVRHETHFEIRLLELESFSGHVANPLLKQLLDQLGAFPIINEFFTSNITAILEKPHAVSEAKGKPIPQTKRVILPAEPEF